MALQRPLHQSAGVTRQLVSGDELVGALDNASFTRTGTVAVGAGTHKWVVPTGNWQITCVTISLAVASSSGAVTCDVNKGGTTIYTTQGNRPSLAASATSAIATLPDVVALAGGDVLTVDVDAAGTGADGVNVTIHYVRTS